MTDDAFEPLKTEDTTETAETHDDAGDDEAVDDGRLLGAADTNSGNENASDDTWGIIGEDA